MDQALFTFNLRSKPPFWKFLVRFEGVISSSSLATLTPTLTRRLVNQHHRPRGAGVQAKLREGFVADA